MAYSTCPKCGSTSFELKENVPATSNFKLLFVQCSSCGCVVGVMDYLNIGSTLEKIEKKIDTLSAQLNNVYHNTLDIDSQVRKLK